MKLKTEQCAAERAGGGSAVAGNVSGVLLSWDGSITHPGEWEHRGPGMMRQWRQGEELARGKF